MPYERVSYDDHLPKLHNSMRRSYELKVLEDPEQDISASARVKYKSSRKDEYSKSHRTSGRKISVSPDSSISSASSRSNTVTIEEYDLLKSGRPSSSLGLPEHGRHQDKNTPRRPILDFGDIVKSLAGYDELPIASDVNLTEKELVSVYKDKVTRLNQEKESLSSQVSHYRKTAESAQSELAAEKVKTSAMQEDLARTKQKIKDLQQEQFDLQCDIENHKQNVARQNALVTSLQQRVRDAEDRSEVKENSLTRNEMAIISLKKELQAQVDKRQQLEVAMKHHASSAEEHSKKSDSWERKFREVTVQLCSILTIEPSHSSSPVEDLLLSKTAEVVREHGSMHRKLEKLMSNVQNSELEAKASRETIMRLVSDVSKEQKAFSDTRTELESLRRELDLSRLCLTEKDVELSRLRDQLGHSQKVWTETRHELEEKISEIDKLDHDMKVHESEGKKAHGKLLHFRRHLANLLSDDLNTVQDDEEMILQHVREMQIANRKLCAVEEKLSSKLVNLNEEMKNRKTLQRTILQRANHAESEFQTLDERIKALEGDLLAADVDRDHLKDERRKYMAFLDKLARAMKLDEIAIDAGFELTADAVLTRGEQLAKKETESIQDRTTAIYALQRKVKSLNEKLESKDLHLNVSKKKCQELEDLLKDKVRIENEKEDTSMHHKRLKKKHEKLQVDFAACQDAIIQLKAELSDTGNLKVENMEQKRIIEDLEAAVSKLAKSKYSTSQQLKGAKENMRNTAKESKEELDRRSELVESLSKELRSARDALKEVANREKQLLEFRRLLANIVGLDADKLSVPDYEIMTRVESLVKAHQTYNVTTKTLEHTLKDLDRGFRSTFNDAVAILHSPRQTVKLKN